MNTLDSSYHLSKNIGCLYLHGFLSSPDSLKAKQLQQYFNDRNCSWQISIPALPFEPEQAIAVAEQAYGELLQDPRIEQIVIIGSSLGGYYATYLAEKNNCKAALINPAVAPYDLFEDYLGPNKHYYSGETHILTMDHIDQLKVLDIVTIRQTGNLLLLLQTKDETLDYQLAANKYQGSASWLEAGGNHSFENFMSRIEMIWYFANRSSL